MKITDHIHLLEIPFQIPITHDKEVDRYVNAFIIFGESIYLIDTGVAQSKEKIYDYIKSQGRKPEEIAKIFLTHSHPDHIGAVRLIKKDTGCEVLAHEAESPWIQHVDKQFEERPIPGFYQFVSGSVKIDRFLKDKEVIKPESCITFEILHTPGHSPGSVSIKYKEAKALFTGDAILMTGELPIYTDVKKYLHTLKRLHVMKGIDIMLSSWDKPRYEHEIISILDKSYYYMRMIQDTVREVYSESSHPGSMIFCQKIVHALGLPEYVANPLTLKSFQANLEVLDQPDIWEK
jgi:glyoxylase-like metal-dependent hydrolase (beta-lactamase superfamily II)